MKKRTEKARTPYGEYTVSHETPDRDVFRLRLEVLRRHEGFREYCTRPDIEDAERDILRAWMDLQGWLSKGPTDYEKCLLIYGNIHRHGQTTWTWYRTAYMNYQTILRSFPFQELKPGTPAPEGMLTVSMDSHIRRDELVRMFERFLTSRRKAFTIGAAGGDPLRGYFHVTEKRFDIDTTRRYLAVHKLRHETEGKRLQAGGGRTKHWTVYKWREEVFKKFPEVYTGTEKKKQEKANKELKYAENIIAWAVRGRFPRTKALK